MGETDGRDVRASDGEREQAVARLREAVVGGRLTLEEFGERAGRAYESQGRTELERLVVDLPAGAAPASAPSEASHRAIFSELTRRGPWRVPPRSSFRCVFGTINLDLRAASIDGALVERHVYNLFGTVTVVVPEGVPVDVEGGGLLASRKIETSAEPVVAAAPRIVIRLSGPGGTLHVRSTPHPERIEALIKRRLRAAIEQPARGRQDSAS